MYILGYKLRETFNFWEQMSHWHSVFSSHLPCHLRHKNQPSCWHSVCHNSKHCSVLALLLLQGCQHRLNLGRAEDLFHWLAQTADETRQYLTALYLSDFILSDRSTVFPQVSQLWLLPSVIWRYEEMASLNPSLTRELSDSVLFLLKITDLEETEDFQRLGLVKWS